MLRHVAEAGFDRGALERVRGELVGVIWLGMALRGSDRVSPADRHYLKHVVKRREWPAGTNRAGYLDSLRRVILDLSSGVFTSIYQGAPQLGVIRETHELRLGSASCGVNDRSG